MSILEDIACQGFAVLRGLLSSAYASDLSRRVSEVVSSPPPRDRANAERFLRNPQYAASSIEELDDWPLFLTECFRTDVREAHERYLGTNFRAVLPHCRVRKQYGHLNRPGGHIMHGWHCDAGVGYTPGRMLNLWLALDACGRTAPSLEFYAGPVAGLSGCLDDESFTARAGGDERIVIEAEPGDAVIFPSLTYHRTQIGPELLADRCSIDLRCIGTVTPKSMVGSETVSV
jgi:ectoine hydroxylase-related dioxygenase (phytanoyl-CoA dioxygenase family)